MNIKIIVWVILVCMLLVSFYGVGYFQLKGDLTSAWMCVSITMFLLWPALFLPMVWR